MVDLLSVPPRGRQHLVLRVDAGLRGGEPTPLGDVFSARTNEYGRKMNERRAQRFEDTAGAPYDGGERQRPLC